MRDAGPESLDYGGLEEATGFYLRLAQVEMFEAFHADLAEHGLSPGAASALILIGANPGIRHGRLATALHIRLAHMSKLLQRFEAEGLVERRRPADDRRSLALHLTEEGARRVAALRPALFEHDARQGARLTADERGELLRLLRKYVGAD
jgi:DNA-binding MarR family transcriptional regulator